MNTWVTKDGREIQLCDMTDCHIRNCINFLMRGVLHFGIDESDIGGMIRRGYEDLPEPASEQTRLWYRLHAWNYVKAFKAELSKR